MKDRNKGGFMSENERGPSAMALDSILAVELYAYSIVFVNCSFTYSQAVSAPIKKFINLHPLIFLSGYNQTKWL